MNLYILLFASLLRLTHAAFGNDDFCTQFYGSALNYQECRAAYDRIPKTELGDFPETTIMRTKMFSSDPSTDPRFKLPQTFTSGQCIIEISMQEGVYYGATTWDYQRKAVKTLLDYCVQPHGIGGRVTQKATNVEIRKKKNKLKPTPAAEVSECAAIPEGSALYKCLKEAEAASVAANRALADFSDRIDGLTYIIAAALDDS